MSSYDDFSLLMMACESYDYYKRIVGEKLAEKQPYWLEMEEEELSAQIREAGRDPDALWGDVFG